MTNNEAHTYIRICLVKQKISCTSFILDKFLFCILLIKTHKKVQVNFLSPGICNKVFSVFLCSLGILITIKIYLAALTTTKEREIKRN